MRLKIKLAQVNLFVGDFTSNYQKISSVIQKALRDRTDILVFPEMAITGYPPEDLVFRKRFIQENMKVLRRIARQCKDLLCIIGFVDRTGDDLFNAAAVIYDKKVRYIYHKINLPNYSVFDEKRYFRSGREVPVIQIKDLRFGLGICEDLWVEDPPVDAQAKYGKTSFIININASPYYLEKYRERLGLLRSFSRKYNNLFLYLNLVGGQDEIVFDGNSLVLDEKGRLILAGKPFEEQTLDLVRDFKEKKGKVNRKKVRIVLLKKFKPHDHGKEQPCQNPMAPPFVSREEEVYKALVLGIRDYIQKNRFKMAVIGLSGGIDSALTCVLAVDAIGKKNVLGVFMPSAVSSRESYEDAKKVADNLGISFHVLPIKEIFEQYVRDLKELFQDLPFNIAEENIQARIRGNLLMAISNKFGHLVLATGNKSEMSTGYSTLYGDLAGGFAVIKDVYKTMVYRLAGYRNELAGFELIPGSIVRKAPTAELRENQKDTDSLPDYAVLDKVLYDYIERNLTYTEIVGLKKFDPGIVKKVINLVDKSEYKRRQAPPGLKISRVSFGKDRRMPITNGYLLRK